jgi:hypothetical protein
MSFHALQVAGHKLCDIELRLDCLPRPLFGVTHHDQADDDRIWVAVGFGTDLTTAILQIQFDLPWPFAEPGPFEIQFRQQPWIRRLPDQK